MSRLRPMIERVRPGQFTLAQLLAFTTISSVLGAFAMIVGGVAIAALIVMTAALAARWGVPAIASLALALSAAGGASQGDSLDGAPRLLLAMLFAVLVCAYYLRRPV